MDADRMAAEVVIEFHFRRAWAYDPSMHAEFQALIADKIRAAVAAERERIAQDAEEVGAIYEISELNPDPIGGWIVSYHDFAEMVRKGG